MIFEITYSDGEKTWSETGHWEDLPADGVQIVDCIQADGALIRVHVCGVCHGDLLVRDGHFRFVRYPIVPGHEIAETVEATGERVGTLARGARVGVRRRTPRRWLRRFPAWPSMEP